MSLQINTNITALNALRNLNNVSKSVSSSIEKLSSGLRINSAADDPSGLVVSEDLRAQIDGLTQAVDNSQNATNLIKTSEGALGEVNTLLRSIRQLAVHAANTGVNDQTATQADQTQISSALASIERIAEQTQFGTKHLLDGTAGLSDHVTNTTNLAGIALGDKIGSATLQAGPVTISVTQAAQRAALIGSPNFANLDDLISNAPGGKDSQIVLNGQTIQIAANETLRTLVNKINNLAGSTGVEADVQTQYTFAGTRSYVYLVQQNYGAGFNIDLQDNDRLIATASVNTVNGTDAIVQVQAQGVVGGSVQTVTSQFTGGQGQGVSGLRVSNGASSLLLTEAGNTTGGANLGVATVSGNRLLFHVGGNAGQTVSTAIGSTRVDSLGTTTVAGKSLATIDVTTAQGAQDAINIVDEAINQVTTLRANLGSFQRQTLESTSRYLGVGVENLSASESRIRDTNVADQVVSLTKDQIIAQAATTVLAQANQSPQQVLKLLQ